MNSCDFTRYHVEHHTEWKYRARVDLEWVNAQKLSKSGRVSDQKEGDQGV